MRPILMLVVILSAAPSFAQAQAPAGAAVGQYPYGLDPYKPSDAALLVNYGATPLAQAPFVELRKLDPYTPSHAALLRQVGGAIPLWGWVWYPPPAVPASLTPFVTLESTAPSAPPVATAPAPGAGAAATTPANGAQASVPGSVSTVRRPDSSDGVWIAYAQQRWISAGPAVPLDSGFTRVGEYAGLSVFTRPGTAGVIYLPTAAGQQTVTPYRLKQ